MSDSLSIEPERASRSPTRAVGPLEDPTWFLTRLDFSRGAGVFTRVDRDELAAQSFLDQNWDRSGAETVGLPLGELIHAEAPPRAPGFIWHTGFCCSTLIARCLDWPGLGLGLKEPVALGDFAIARDSRNPRATPELACSVVRLLGRPFAPGARVVIKPTTYANSLIPLVADQAGPMLFLHTELRRFLQAVVKGGEGRRFQARNLLAARVVAGRSRLSMQDVSLFTDAQAAAVFWRLQMQDFRWAAQRVGPERALLLDAQGFLDDPAEVLQRLDRFFGLGLGAERIAGIVSGPRFLQSAKNPKLAFDPDRERKALDEAGRLIGEDYEALEAWSASVAGDAALR